MVTLPSEAQGTPSSKIAAERGEYSLGGGALGGESFDIEALVRIMLRGSPSKGRINKERRRNEAVVAEACLGRES